MEIIGILFIILVIWLIFKVAMGIFQAGFWLIALPFKLLALFIALIIGIVVILPLTIVAGVIGLFALPLMILGGLLPFILVGAGLWLLLRRN